MHGNRTDVNYLVDNRYRNMYTRLMSKQPKPRKTHILSVRVDDDLKAAIEVAAEEKDWSVSHWLAVMARTVLGLKK
jgi:predicted HicB family RNase H-like nuclease